MDETKARDLLKRALAYLTHEEDDPYLEGDRSPEAPLCALIGEIEDALGIPDEERSGWSSWGRILQRERKP